MTAPAIDLGAILEETRPRDVVVPEGSGLRDQLTQGELAMIGRELGLTVRDFRALESDPEQWDAIDMGLAVVWAILRRVEPALTWEEARRTLRIVPAPPDPPRAAGRKRRPAGTATSSRPRS